MFKQKKVVLGIGIILIVAIVATIVIISFNKKNTATVANNKGQESVKNSNIVTSTENSNIVASTENSNIVANNEGKESVKNSNIVTSTENSNIIANNNIVATNTIIKPMTTSLDINSLKDCTFAATFKASDVYLNNDGALVTHMQVMVFETFDAVDIAKMVVGDTLKINGNDMLVKSIEREGKVVTINGGLEKGGCYLKTEENGQYYETIFNDLHRYYSIGETTLPVDQEFILVDNSDLYNKGKTLYAGDFLQEMKNSKKEFSENATIVRVENGYIKNITLNYVP